MAATPTGIAVQSSSPVPPSPLRLDPRKEIPMTMREQMDELERAWMALLAATGLRRLAVWLARLPTR